MPGYCSTELQGDKCTDSRCQYRHDILRCEPCGRSFPAPLLTSHENGKLHLSNVYLSGPLPDSCGTSSTTFVDPWDFAPSPPSQLTSRSPQPQFISPPSEGETNITVVDPRVIVSCEDGLDFTVAGKETAACAHFPVVNGNILIEKTEVVSSLSVESMTLVYSPGQDRCFSASLTGTNNEVRKKKPRKIIVSFKALHAGTFHVMLKINFSDKTRPYDREFTVIRELRGYASLPTSASVGTASDVDVPGVLEETTEEEDPGIVISPDFALEFSMQSLWPNEPSPIQTKELVITRSSHTLVTFTTAMIYSPDVSMIESFSAKLEGDSRVMKPNQRHIVTVSFTPRQGGHCEAVLELTFRDHKRKIDFVVERTLSGWAERPTSGKGHQFARLPAVFQPINNAGNHCRDEGGSVIGAEKFIDSDGTGISVSHEDGLDFGIVGRKRPNGPFMTPSSLLTIKHAYGVPAVTFVKERTRTIDGSDPEFVAVFEGDSLNIQPGTESAVRVIFSPKFEGLFKATLELGFYHSHRRAWFYVRRSLQGTAGSLEDHRHLEFLGQEDDDKPTESSQGVPPQKIILLPRDQRRRSRYFPDYEVPPIVQQAVNNSSATRPYDKNAPDLVSALRPDNLNVNTYAHYFASLLGVEDGHRQYVRSSKWDVLCQPENEVHVQGYDQQYRYLHSVEIENDDEDLLPEVVLGDFLWLDDVKNHIRYEASVAKIDVFTRHHLAVLKMLVRLPPDFNLYQGTQFVVQLRHNRIILRHQYHVLTNSFVSPRRLLFPSVSDIKPKRHLSRAEIYNLKFRHLVNRTIRDDPQQLQAVISILEQPPGSVPFLVYGPVGTGKTSTIIESILQLVRRDEGVRILACTPSDVATRLFAERLVAAGLDSARLYLLDAPLPYEEDVSDDVRAIPQIPGHERLLAFSVVLSTCSKATILQTLDVPVGHFSHIVIDEAAQAEEPLVMIPIMTFSNSYTNIILAGDPNQLSPAIESAVTARSGLGKSYFQRLMLLRDVYGFDTHVGKTIAVLRRNWRSHGAIIAWSNRYLYEDMTRDHGNPHITYHLVNSDILPKRGFPVIFHGVRGSQERTKSSPTYFNVLEASVIRDYCVKLVSDPERKIYPEEIGIVAPYKAQIRAIRQLLKAAKISDISVGSVEQFQGQERKVIILATTRSNEENHPRKSSGLWANRQRMNVAITRAQALLIVIGDPEVLGKFEHWRTFLKYVKSRKGWIGKMHNWGDEEVVHPRYEIISRKDGIAHGDEFIDGKSEKIYRTSENSGVSEW